MRPKPVLALTLVLLGITACGGGSGGGNSPPDPPTPPQTGELVWDNGNWDEVNWQ